MEEAQHLSKEDAIAQDGLRVSYMNVYGEMDYIYIARPLTGQGQPISGNDKIQGVLFEDHSGVKRVIIEFGRNAYDVIDLSAEDRKILNARPKSILGWLIQAELIVLRLDPDAEAFE